MIYLGDYLEDETVYFLWSSNAADGASITRSTNGTVSVYKDNGTTQSTEGVTDTEDFDSLTGIHACTIVTTNAFYAAGADYAVVLSAATIDGETVNAVLAHFSIQNRYMRGTDSAATATALATVDGIVDDILVDTGTTLPATLETIDNFLDTEIAAILEDTGTTIPALLTTIDNFLDTEVAAILEDTGTTLPATLAAMGTPPTVGQVADAVWDEALSGHVAVGSAGKTLGDAATYTQVSAAIANGTINTSITGSYEVAVGNTWSATITGLGNMVGRTKLYVMVKTAITDNDNASIIQWTEGTGLTRLAGAATTAGYGTITVDDATDGDITLTLALAATSGLAASAATGLTLAVKCIKADEIWERYGVGNFEIADGWIDATS